VIRVTYVEDRDVYCWRRDPTTTFKHYFPLEEGRIDPVKYDWTDIKYHPTDIINDENGNALNEPHLVLNRWRKYFEELLNLQCEGQPSQPRDR
jgi:hypothetical protein